eukprot:644295-Pleurochrysis_carterae.AAC.1
MFARTFGGTGDKYVTPVLWPCVRLVPSWLEKVAATGLVIHFTQTSRLHHMESMGEARDDSACTTARTCLVFSSSGSCCLRLSFKAFVNNKSFFPLSLRVHGSSQLSWTTHAAAVRLCLPTLNELPLDIIDHPTRPNSLPHKTSHCHRNSRDVTTLPRKIESF